MKCVMYNKTSLFGKLIVGAFTGMLLFTGVQTAHVYANNNSDTAFEFNFDGYSAEETSKRLKEDVSAAWMGCYEFDGFNDVGYLAYVYGYEGYHSNDGECCSSSYLFHEDISNYMRNFVKENGNDYATIKANLCDYEAASYSGYWSPDNMSGY